MLAGRQVARSTYRSLRLSLLTNIASEAAASRQVLFDGCLRASSLAFRSSSFSFAKPRPFVGRQQRERRKQTWFTCRVTSMSSCVASSLKKKNCVPGDCYSGVMLIAVQRAKETVTKFRANLSIWPAMRVVRIPNLRFVPNNLVCRSVQRLCCSIECRQPFSSDDLLRVRRWSSLSTLYISRCAK